MTAGPDSSYSWLRLALSLLLGTISSVTLWSFVVALPAVQADFGVTRADVSLPYTLVSVGFAFGGLVTGRITDRFGITLPVICGAVLICAGYVASGLSQNLWQLSLAHGLLIGVGGSAMFGPLMADVSHWFVRRRGIAVAVSAAGNYLGGAIWPPIVQHFIATQGWRETHIGIGLFCLLAIVPIGLMLRRRPDFHGEDSGRTADPDPRALLGLSPAVLQVLLVLAGLTCCLAMSMPQIHIVAYCGDLGYGPARGAEMLTLMLGFGLISRITTGLIADRIGGLPTLLVGSGLQAVALLMYAAADGLTSLYVISALFGLFQGGIVPSYAIIVREYFPAREAATRVSLVMMATLFGMAIGGWMCGAIFDLTGSYRLAFLNGFLWNLVNAGIALWLLRRPGPRVATA